MKYWEHGALRVSENRKYLKNGDTPFFWLGDTAWLLLQQSSGEDARIYLKNRADKGFNVIQAVLVNSLPGEEANSLTAVNCDVTSAKFWKHCDEVINIAGELGIYMGLLPSWGSIVKYGMLNTGNAAQYADFLYQRYKDRPNIIWILGGDILGTDGLDFYREFGRLLKEKMPDKLIAYHPFGRTASSMWFQQDEWLDINMFQSGHRRYDQPALGRWDDGSAKEEFFGEDNWKYVDRDLRCMPVKPTLDGEPSYEQIPQGLHDPSQPYWQAWDVRRYAYWSVFQGAAGHTYGDNAIQQFYTGKKPGKYGVKETWQDSIHHEGSCHMKHLKDLMNSVDFTAGRPAEELLLSGQGKMYDRISVFAGENFIFCYDYMGKEFTLDLTGYTGKQLYAYWLDPVSGVYSYLGDMTGKEVVTVKPVSRFSGHNDWVLVLKNQ